MISHHIFTLELDRSTYFKAVKLAERSLVIAQGPTSTKCLGGETKEKLQLVRYHYTFPGA